MKRILVTDRVGYSITKREYTDNGFLIVPGRVARSGIQQYLASELGLTDRKPNELINVYRPADEVFHPDSLKSYDSSDVTIEHPSTMVDSDTYVAVSKGVVSGEAIQDGDFVQANLIIKSKDAIKAVESGKVQLSAGYTAEYDDTPCIIDGVNCEFTQRNIRINHVALVDNARAGAQARLFDNNHNQGVTPMKKVILDSGRSVEIEDGAVATLVEDSFARLTKQVADAEAKAEKAEAEKDAKEEELEKAKKESSDSVITERVQVIAKTLDTARKIAGSKFQCDSVDLATIQREALTVVRDSVKWADKSDTYVQAAFDMAEEKEEMDEDEDKKESKDSYRQLAQDAAPQKTNDAPVKSAYDSFKERQADAHKGAK